MKQKHKFKLIPARNFKAMTVYGTRSLKIDKQVFVCENCKMKTMDNKPYLNQECTPTNDNRTNSMNSSFGSFAVL